MKTLTLRRYTPPDRNAFRDLNIAWIEQHFVLEEKDRATLDDPETYILEKGGEIIIAEGEDGTVIGTVALIPVSNTRVELAKMAVDERTRGSGIGRKIIEAATQTAKEMGANEIWLESNTGLKPAIRLYETSGFRRLEAHEATASPYCRCDIQMIKEI